MTRGQAGGSATRGGAVVVLAKVPRTGRVKTRMCPPLDPDQAAELYACMLADVLQLTNRAARRMGLDAVLALHPIEEAGGLLSRVPGGFRIVAQRGRDLSERMAWALAEALAAGCDPVLLRGSDSPALGEECLERALDELQSCDLVLAPDVDGGYNLVGLHRSAPGLFDHPMSTGSELRDTLAIAGELGLRARVLGETFDLDRAADLVHLAAARDAGRAGGCPATLAFLDEHGLWDGAA